MYFLFVARGKILLRHWNCISAASKAHAMQHSRHEWRTGCISCPRMKLLLLLVEPQRKERECLSKKGKLLIEILNERRVMRNDGVAAERETEMEKAADGLRAVCQAHLFSAVLCCATDMYFAVITAQNKSPHSCLSAGYLNKHFQRSHNVGKYCHC